MNLSKPLRLNTLQVWHKGKLHCTVQVLMPTVSSQASLYFEWHTEDDSLFHQLCNKHGRFLACKSFVAAMDQFKGLVAFCKQFKLGHVQFAGSLADRTGIDQLSSDERKICHPSKAKWIGILRYAKLARQQDLSGIAPEDRA